MSHIKKQDLIKLIKFSNKILIENNVLFAIKLGEKDELNIIDLSLPISCERNAFFFITKEILKDINDLDNNIQIKFEYDDNGSDYIIIYDDELNVRIETLRSVAIYVG